MKKAASVFVMVFLAGTVIAVAASYEAEEQAVREAVLDYVEGVYEVAPGH